MDAPISNHRKLKRSQILVIGLIVAMVGGLFLFMFLNREPAYQGRPLSEWLLQLDSTKAPSEFMEARAAIHAIGEPAIPYLLPFASSGWKIMEAKDSGQAATS